MASPFPVSHSCSVNIEFPKIEVRYEDLTVDAYVHVGSRALPTIPNFICNMTEVGPVILGCDISFRFLSYPSAFQYTDSHGESFVQPIPLRQTIRIRHQFH